MRYIYLQILKLGKIESFVNKALDVPSAEAVKAAIVNLQNLVSQCKSFKECKAESTLFVDFNHQHLSEMSESET